MPQCNIQFNKLNTSYLPYKICFFFTKLQYIEEFVYADGSTEVDT